MQSKAKLGWFPPSLAITAAVLATACLLIPFTHYDTAPPVLQFGTGWFLVMMMLGLIWFACRTTSMMIRRVPSPISVFATGIRTHYLLIAQVVVGFVLTGLIQLGFNWVKPQIPLLVPFWADPMLAGIDHALFGTDAWRPLRALLGDQIAFFDYLYSLWYPITLLALFGVLIRQRAEAICAYFMLWGLFGTIVQACLSAAGPIYWARIGLGSRFDALVAIAPPGTRGAADYLWASYTQGINQIAVGISAMPSMHVAMACWLAIAYWRTKLAFAGIAYWLLVFIASVALGWHYFIDGVIGSLGAVACYRAARFIVDLPAIRFRPSEPAVLQPSTR